MNTCKEQEQLAYNTELSYNQCSSICLVFLSSSLHRRTSSCLITGNRFCTSLSAMQNIWFNISIFYHALTAERINSTLQFPRTSMLNLCFFFYIRISVFCPIWSHLIFLSLCCFVSFLFLCG